MLSGEVGYFKGTMQLTHPAFLVLESPSGQIVGTKSLKTIAATSGATGDELLSAFERDFFPIYPGQHEGAELGHLRVRAPGARRARPGRRSAAENLFCSSGI